MKKKIFICLLATSVALSMAGCGTTDGTAQTDTNESTEATSESDSSNTVSSQTTDGNTRLVSVDNVEDYITLGEYKGIVLQKEVVEVTDSDVENNISDNLKNHMKTVLTKGATVQEGDLVAISYVGTMDGVAFDGGTGDTQDLTIGSGTMIPGFEDGIIGMKTGETKDVEVTFPENYRATDLAGKSAVFEITLQSFKRAPELTEDWVTENTDYASLDEYRAGVRAELEEQAETDVENNLKMDAWTTVSGDSEVKEYPQTDIDNAVASFKSQIEAYAKQADMTLDEYVESQGISTEDFETECTQYAQQKVKQDLVIQGIMDAEGMTLEDEESLAIQDQILSAYGTDLATLVDTYGQEAVDETIGLLRVEDFIVANANIEQKSPETTTEATTGAAETTAQTTVGATEAVADIDNTNYSSTSTNKNSTSTVRKCDADGCTKNGTNECYIFGECEYYCNEHYQEVMDTVNMMEEDVGEGTASKHLCEECGKEGTHEVSGLGGTEYYCTEHYNELMGYVNQILGE